MQIDISFRHMEPSEPLRAYAEEKVSRVIRKHIRDDFDAQVTLSIEKFRHIANFLLAYKGISIKCEESSEDMYTSIDLALDKLERQIRRYKDKLRIHKPAKVDSQRTYEVAVVAAPEVEDSSVSEVVSADVAEEPVAREVKAEDAPSTKILKHEKISVEEMSVDDAVMKISLEDAPCLVFINDETKAINVLYKMEDGKFGLIDPNK